MFASSLGRAFGSGLEDDDIVDVVLGALRCRYGSPLVRDIAYYFRHFPDTVHHRAEDTLFGALERKSSDLKSCFDALRLEHAEIAEIGQEFHIFLETVCSVHVAARDKITSAIENFLERQRRHIDTEEGGIFLIAKAYLSDEIVAAFASIHAEVQDPLFGTETRDSFTRLREAIMEKA